MGFFKNNNITIVKIIFASLILFMSSLTACKNSSNNDDIKHVPGLINVLASPQHYANNQVALIGYLDKYMKLHVSKELAMFGPSTSGIQVQDVTSDGLLINSTCLSKYVDLSGKLKKSSGSSGVFFITEVKRVSTFDNNGKLNFCYVDEKFKSKVSKFQQRKKRVNKKLNEGNL